MEIKEFADLLLQKAKADGFEEAEVYYSGSSQFEVMIFEQEISHFENSKLKGLSFRGLYGGQMGYAYTERIAEEEIPFLLKEAKENAGILSEEEKETIYAGDENYPEVCCYRESMDKVTVDEKIEKALSMEKKAKSFAGIEAVNYCLMGTGSGEVFIQNTKGLSLFSKENSGFAYVSALAKKDEEVKTGSDHWIGNDFGDFSPESVGENAAREALAHLGAKSVPTGTYPILLRNDVAGDLLATYAGVFFAESVQKGFSLLKGKLGQDTAAGIVTLRDDPLLEHMPGSAPFDSEGVAAKNKVIIEKGKLATFLYNLKSAAKDGVASTGNGFKSGFKSPVGTAPTNFYIEKGARPLEAIIKELKQGILITDVAGLHSGANTVSGDFSLSAEGFYICDGKIEHPVEQITISGNFYTMLMDIIEIASDLKFNMNGGIGAPSLHVKKMSVSGE